MPYLDILYITFLSAFLMPFIFIRSFPLAGILQHQRNLSLKNARRKGTAVFSSTSDDYPWMKITSTKNPTVKLIRSLLSKKKYRDEHRLTIVEGHRLVTDLLSSSNRMPHILVTKKALEHSDFGPSLTKLLLRAENSSVHVVTDEVMKVCSDTVTPQGILATIAIPSNDNEFDVTTDGLFLILDGVSDPGNVGTLLRTSVAVGMIPSIILLHDNVDVYSPKTIRSSMGSVFQIPSIVQVSSLKECRRLLDRWRVEKVYAATMLDDRPTKAYWEIDWVSSPRMALCIGGEASGLSHEVRDAIQRGEIDAVHLPMREGSIESLNAAVSGSVIMFEYLRQWKMLHDDKNKI